uniref:Uncharacterized protein n=1 Tax=Timema genevievae TaxID=629358 RepID=A0A7R9JV38_TIMGE|nr:unnamed protein product [Timema genevievae]
MSSPVGALPTQDHWIRSTNADSPPLRAHPDLVLEFKYCEKFVQRGHARSFGQPRTDISIILQKCCSELDVSIVDRITALLNPQPLCKRNPNKFSGDKHSMAKPTTIKDALKRWEEKHKTNPAEATEVIISFQWPPIEKMDSSLGVLTKCE